jgi:DNA-binding XRE family transcriptional regulator
MKTKNQNYNKFKREMLGGRPGLRALYAKSEAKHILICEAIDARLAMDMTQTELARKMGTKQTVISRFESGLANPTYDFLVKLASALGRKLTISLPQAI